MPDLRDMELLAALARHGHFARAAEECGISQPAFSARIRNLERDLGAPIVRRGNRFAGFTPEGEIVLRWARRMMRDADGLKQDLAAARGGLTGRVAVGAIPTAVPFAARVPVALHRAHPGLNVEIRSASSAEILRGLADMTLDAGITYMEPGLAPALTAEPLYEETYVLVAPREMVAPEARAITWTRAADLPLSLLTRDMQNRRIIDQVFAGIGAEPRPVLETNAFTAALAQVEAGTTATIAPAMLAAHLPMGPDTVCLPLTEPEHSAPVGLVTAAQDPAPPLVRALSEACHTLA